MDQNQTNRKLAVVEHLEERRMLSATLSKGTLLVSGTRHSDAIGVYTAGRHGAFTYVNVDGQSQRFSTSAVKSIAVTGGRGADSITIANSVDPATGVVVSGGDDNDTITGGGGNETLDGGNGDDSIMGGTGTDSINGDAGNDTCIGGSGNDTVDGGAGNDSLEGGTGNDLLDGQGGTDTCMGGQGQDTLVGGNGDNLQPGPHGTDHHDPNEDGGGPGGPPGGPGGPGGGQGAILGKALRHKGVFAA